MILDLDDRNKASFFGTEGSGHQNKIWCYHNGNKYLVKINSKYREASKEEAVSKILDCAGIEHVKYKKIKARYSGRDCWCCVCKSFLNQESDYSITLAYLLSGITVQRNEPATVYFDKSVEIASNSLGINADTVAKYLITMVTVDYLVMNSDRHLNNIEFICSNGIWRPAPLFDFGQSFLKTDKKMTTKEFEMEQYKFKSKPFSSNPERNLINIEYAKHIGSHIYNSVLASNLDISDWYKFVLTKRYERLIKVH